MLLIFASFFENGLKLAVVDPGDEKIAVDYRLLPTGADDTWHRLIDQTWPSFLKS
jgi:hypothetical protein